MLTSDTQPQSPGEFLRSQRGAIAVGALLTTGIMLAAIFSVDAAYNYPRMITDQLLYYMKGLSLVQDGTLAARTAVNLRPFHYAATPGVLRVPFIAAFSDFDDRLRAIQVGNIVFGVVLATMSAYVLSWVMPRRLSWIAVAFSFATIILNPVWVTNMLSPLADLPYAVASLGSIIVLNRIIRGTEAEKKSVSLKILFALLFVVAFGCRYTAPVILVYGWILFRHESRRVESHSGMRRAFIAAGILLTVLVVGDFQTIVGSYLWQPYQFLTHSHKVALVLNTIVVGFPSSIVPGFGLLYRAPPLDLYNPQFASNAFDFGLSAAGIAITTIVAYGMWIGRSRFKAEMWYVLLPLPVLAAMIPSTQRYLLSYQPFIWLFFYLGASHLVVRAASRVPRRTAQVVAVLFCGVVAALTLYIRSDRLTGDPKVTLSSFSLGQTRRHAPEIAATFRSLRRFLETLPRDRALLLGDRGATGQWKVISGIDYYAPDSAMAKAVQARDIYMAMDCSSRVHCRLLDGAIKRRERRIQRFGAFDFEPVFETRNDHSAAVVLRLKAAN